MRHYRLILLIPVLVMACKGSKVSSSDASELYTEDLSYLRPELKPQEVDTASNLETVLINTIGDSPVVIKEELDSINQLIKARNKATQYVSGYAVQIYTGNDKDAANEAMELAIAIDSTLSPAIAYYPPTFKVKAGQYTNRLRAHKVYEDLKAHFPRALLVPERIELKND